MTRKKMSWERSNKQSIFFSLFLLVSFPIKSMDQTYQSLKDEESNVSTHNVNSENKLPKSTKRSNYFHGTK